MEKECTNKKEIGKKIQLAKASGETIDYVVDIPICAFICDATAAALSCGAHASAILASPVIIIECTYLEEIYRGSQQKGSRCVDRRWWALCDCEGKINVSNGRIY